ncbi:MAG: M12 family metallo-peptidase [Pyrinomonadaceae bacterium]
MRSVSVCLLLLMFACIFLVDSFAQGKASGGLFSINESPKVVSETDRSSIASVREAAIIFEVRRFNGTDDGILSIPLFDGREYQAKRLQREGLELRSSDDFTWRGKIDEGSFSGDVVITYKKGHYAGLIYSPNAVYEIVPKGNAHILFELDQSLYPSCAGGVKGDEARSRVGRAAGAAVDSGDRIDVMVLYTAAVRTSAGGDTQAQTIAQNAIDATNTAYINSKIRQRVRLVGAENTSLVETGNFSTELSNLRADATAATRRDALKADLVSMLTNSTAACGIGYLMGSLGGNQNNGFSVTARTCAVGNLSFAHELGHNMASHHNPENGGTAVYAYGYGHYVNGSYRTVMSYSDPCTSGCTRVPYFSNPTVIFNNQPTGVDNARDNARSINNTADWIANYRYSGSSITLGSFNGDQIVPRNLLRSLIWTSDNVTGNVKIEISRDGGSSWQTLFDPTPNDHQEYFSFGNRATRRARIRITSLSDPAVSDSSVANISIR